MDPDRLPLIDSYIELLGQWNTKVRLTGYRSPDEIRHHLVFEPMSAFRYFSLSNNSHPLVDLGSGNGSPGLIFAILAPHRQVYLIERRQKKMTFLLYVAGKLNLKNVRVFPDISEVIPVVPNGLLEIWAKAVSWKDLFSATSGLVDRYDTVLLRKFGNDLPAFSCSSCLIHGINVEEYFPGRQRSSGEVLNVSEAILKQDLTGR